MRAGVHERMGAAMIYKCVGGAGGRWGQQGHCTAPPPLVPQSCTAASLCLARCGNWRAEFRPSIRCKNYREETGSRLGATMQCLYSRRNDAALECQWPAGATGMRHMLLTCHWMHSLAHLAAGAMPAGIL